jgi:MFS transporter, DHA1 family, tetracycline resistance protein
MKNSKVLSILFLTLLLDTIGIGMLIPIIPSLFTDASSASFLLAGYSVKAQYLIAGLVTALFGLMQFVAAPILGELSDMYGRKKLLTLGVGVLALSQLLFAMGIAVHSLFILLISRAIAGVAGANFSIAQATIADVTTPENRARNFGLIGASFGLGFVIGPIIGGTLVGATGNAALPFIFAGLLGIINVLLVTFFLPETHHVRAEKKKLTILRALHNVQHAYEDADIRPFYFSSFFVMLGFGFYTTFIPILLSERFNFSESMTGTYFGVVGMWIIFAQMVVVRVLSRRYADASRLLYALPIVSFCIFLQPFMPEALYLYIIMPIQACSFALVTTSIPALISKRAGGEKQGMTLGINGSLQALSQVIAPLSAGLVSGVLGITSAFVIGAFFIALAFGIMLKDSKNVAQKAGV